MQIKYTIQDEQKKLNGAIQCHQNAAQPDAELAITD